nr:ubiquinone biosynthesis regulatory protein kinase UbiB [Salinisphaera sp.]
PQLVLLQKTILNVEGLGRDLYPQLDLWATAKPILEDWMLRRASPKRAAERMKHKLPQIMDKLPDLTTQLLTYADDGETPGSRRMTASLAEITHELRTARRAMRWTVVGTGLVVSAVVLGVYDPAPIWLAWVSGVVGLGCWIRAWRG